MLGDVMSVFTTQLYVCMNMANAIAVQQQQQQQQQQNSLCQGQQAEDRQHSPASLVCQDQEK
mgnify:CR=1 FL=1